MKKGLIMTLPKWDNVTEYLSHFSKQIIEVADKNGISFKYLEEKDANRKNFEKVVNNLDYNFIVFNGHGSSKSIKGHKNEILVEVGDNEDIIQGRIVYARACEAGAVLGRVCTENRNDGCFIGYEFPFVFWADKTWDSIPMKDETAKKFLEPSNMVAISLIKGHTTREAHENAIMHMKKNFKKEIMKGTKDSFQIAEALWNNYTGQVLLGNPMATM